MTHHQSKTAFFGILASTVLAGFLFFAATVSAAAPDFVLRMPEGQVEPGSGAAELNHPRGIAGNSSTGHVYIADRRNARVSEYTAWGLFVKAWGWGVANGASELQTCGPAAPEAMPVPALCQEALFGSGAGQFQRLQGGMAVDGAGNVWVGDSENLRVQKFNPAGEFLLMFGGEVNKTTKANVCRQEDIEGGDECGIGIAGEGPGQISETLNDVIAYSPTADAIVVGGQDRIQIFNLDGSFREEIPFEGELAPFAGKSVAALDVDSAGNIYVVLSGTEDVYKLSETGEPLAPGKPLESQFEVGNPLAVAVDVEGNVYAVDDPPGALPALEAKVVEFDAAANRLVPTEEEETEEEFFPYVPFLGPALTGLTTNVCEGSEAPGNLYVSFFTDGATSHVNAYGTGPVGCEPPPPNPPQITAQYATEVGREEATLKAQINPRFFTDTTYYVEYGTGKCSEGGCDKTQPAPSSPAQLTSKAVNAPVTSADVLLAGLEPGTTYHYRFVAQSGGGGPVIGEDPDGDGPAAADFANGVERTFRTFAAADPPAKCPANEAFRTGPSAELPDCRAYELVSPLDKENADVALWLGGASLVPRLLELHQSAPSGERITYTSTTAFANPKAAPYVSQYLANRGPGGWSSESLSPPRTASPVPATTLLSNEFNGFSADLCSAWLRHYSVAPLVEGAIEGFGNIYRRENCSGPGSYEALTTVEPPVRPPEDYFELRALGFSEDNTHSIFTANDKLVEDAPTLASLERLLYEHTPEGLRFVCYLPNGNPIPQACSAGTAAGTAGGNESSVRNAISADGTRIFWSAYSGTPGGGSQTGIPGQIYVRIDGEETVRVSGSKGTSPAWFWTAADDGSKAIFEFASGPLQDQLYEFDVASETAKLIAKEVEGPMGASEDASRIYFASSEDLDGGGAASAGAHNLYLYQADEEGGAGTFTFVMALSGQDVGGSDSEPGAIDEVPAQRSAAVSPDGGHVAFTSSVSPTPSGYDNLDANAGEPAEEVYLYDAAEEELRCVSCNPTGARPVAEDIGGVGNPVWVAARIQGWETFLHTPRVLSDDGGRLYFESHEALVPSDTNGAWDVYQWEGVGAGSCTEAEAAFSQASEGCVDLISSGESPADSTFLDADPSGKNVFIGTLSSLIAPDYGLSDVYDARVGGGFPIPEPPSECEGEACQSPPPPPPEVTPASATFKGPGNAKKPKPCRRGMRKVRRRGKSRCVRKARRQPKQSKRRQRSSFR